MKDLAKGGIAGTVVLVIAVTAAFMISGADYVEVPGAKIGNNPEPDSTTNTITSSGENSVNIIGSGNIVELNSKQIAELDQKINLLLDNAGIPYQVDPKQNIDVTKIQQELEQVKNERNQLQLQLEEQNQPVPDIPLDTLLREANVHYYAKQYQKAVTNYDAIIAIDPEDVNAWNNRGVALGNLGQYEDAVKSYDEAIRLDPENLDAINNRELVLSKMEN